VKGGNNGKGTRPSIGSSPVMISTMPSRPYPYPGYGPSVMPSPVPGYGPGYGGGAECAAVSCNPGGGASTYPLGPGDYYPGGAGCAVVSCNGADCGPGAAVTTMSYVGGGVGDYTQETTYRYVGRGAGEYGVMQVPLARPNYCLCICVPLLLLLLICPFLYLLLSSSSHHAAHIHCFHGPPPSTWGPIKSAWCCHHTGRGCPTTTTPPPPPPPTLPPTKPPPPPPTTQPPPPPTTTHCPFDCNAGYKDIDEYQWVKGWSGAKKLYCCRTVRKGCPSELPPPSGVPPSGLPPTPDTFRYDCNAGYHNCYTCLQRQWSPNKLEYCCKNQNKGCKWNTKKIR